MLRRLRSGASDVLLSEIDFMHSPLNAADKQAEKPIPSIRSNRVLAIVCVGIVLANLDSFIVNVALPNIARDLGEADLERLSWILNGYAIVYAALLVFFERLERYRRNASFLLAVAVFTGTRAVCAAATSLEVLAAPRIVQAAGAALMTPASLGLLLATFPPDQRGHAVRTWTAIGGFASALGPVVGGFLLELAMDLYGQRADRTVSSRDRAVEVAKRPRSSDPLAASPGCSAGDRWRRCTDVRHHEYGRMGLGLEEHRDDDLGFRDNHSVPLCHRRCASQEPAC
jgi:hypothetical protein